jgi:hypothetical protein
MVAENCEALKIIDDNLNNIINNDFQQRNEFASRLNKKKMMRNNNAFDFSKMMEIFDKDEDKEKSKFLLGINL